MKGIRILAGASLLAFMIAAGSTPVAAQTAQAPRQFDIPAGPLGAAVAQLGHSAGVMIAVDPGVVRGKRSRALHGRYTAAAALDALLAGSSVKAVSDGRGGYTLVAAPVGATRRLAAPSAQRPAHLADTQAPAAEPAPEIVVTADWLGQASIEDVFRHAGGRDALRRQDFEDTGAVSVRDVLARIPGVNAPASNGTGNHEMALNFGVRGLNPRLASRSTVLIDGIPLPFAPYGQPQLSLSGVTLGNLDAVDVVRGGGSVRYGPQNVGGIVNFVTRAIPRDFSADLSVQGGVATQGESGLRTSANALIGGTTEGGLGVALLYGTIRGSTYRAHSDSRVDDVMLKLRYEIDDRQTVSAIAQYYEGKADMPGGLTVAQYRADPWQSVRPYDNFFGNRWLGGVTYEFRPTGESQWTTTAFKTRTLRSGNLDQGTNLTLSPRLYHVTGIETRFSQGFDLGPTHHLIGAGYRFVHETGAERRYWARKSLGVLPTKDSPFDRDTRGRTNAHAFYIDDRIDIGAFSVTPGLRYEFIDSQQANLLNGTVLQGSYSVPLPALNVTLRPARNWMLFANTMGSFGSVQYSRIAVAEATRYGPEKARTWEAGGRFDDGAIKLEATLFYIHFDNQYESNQQTNSVTARGKTRHQGVELASAYRFSGPLAGLELYANYSFVDATIREEGANKGNRVPFASRHTGRFGANYRLPAWTFNIDAQAQSNQFADNANTGVETAAGNAGRIPGFLIVGGRASHDFGPDVSNLSLSLGVRNLFDRRYYTRSFDDNNLGRYVEEPRTLYVQASIKL